MDRKQLEEVEDLISASSEFSRKYGLTIEFEYNDEAIGWIEQGEPDEGLTIGLIGEWRRVLDGRS
jgi:hypothetical protein